MKILAWNIRHGGGSRSMGRIALTLLEHAPDVLVLNEFRWATGGQILGALADHGWVHRVVPEAGSRQNAVALASRHELAPVDLTPAERGLGVRLVAARVCRAADGEGVTVVGVHIPCSGLEKRAFWTRLVALAERLADERAVIIGDFNTGRRREDEQGATFSCAGFLTRLAAMGYADAWRRTHPGVREYSWYSPGGNGFRLDHAWVSRALAGSVSGAWYSHEEREANVSDHSALVVRLGAGAECP